MRKTTTAGSKTSPSRERLRGHARFWLLIGVLIAANVGLGAPRPALAVACRPPASAAMLTGPVWEAISAECRWVDAQSRRDRASAARLLAPEFTSVDATGRIIDRSAVLQLVGTGVRGSLSMNVNTVRVPFSSGSTNVVIATWMTRTRTYRVMDVFFCNVSAPQCVYRLVAEQLTVAG
jgi:hypothetical protein